jgi:hypothetical protein
MENLTHYPLLVLAAAFVTLWLASLTGSWLRRRNPIAGDDQNEDIGVILAATLSIAKGRQEAFYGTAFCHLDCLASDRRYRCSEAWFDSHQSTEPGQPSEGAWALNLLARQASTFRQISGKGRSRHFGRRAAPSALPRSTEILGVRRHVSMVPRGDIRDQSRNQGSVR